MTTFRFCRVLSVLALVLLLVGCGGGGESTEDGGGDAAAASSDSAEAGSVTIADLKYSPADLEVSAGSTVTWTNDDDAPHTVTFDDDAVSDSEELAKGDEFSATFDEAGEFSYVCAIHPDMKATVTVQ